jgi:hypothetical protein
MRWEFIITLVVVLLGLGGASAAMQALKPGRRNRTPDDEAKASRDQHPPRVL